MRVAIIGAGVAGLACARALAGRDELGALASLDLYEAGPRAGGHVYTVDADGHAIDMGFIVCNRERYPHFMRLLDGLGVKTRATTMAFSVALPAHDLEWGSGDLGAMFADRRRLVDRRHWRFLLEVVGFLRRARADLGTALVASASLDEYLAARGGSPELRERFAIPLAAALWSLAPDRCGEFPAATYLAFLDQHGMLHATHAPRWETVVGGSRTYVDALVADLRRHARFALHVGTPVATVARDADGVTVVAGGRERRYDRVVLATHADTALALLANPSEDERAVLGAFRYSENHTVLHTDRAFLPRHARAHAAWNYVADPDTARVAVTYSMTRLQGLPDAPYLVTLNPRRAPRNALHAATFHHPQFDRAALAAQPRLAAIGAAHRTYYAGAHAGFGFHEDGMRAGLGAAARVLADRARPGRAP